MSTERNIYGPAFPCVMRGPCEHFGLEASESEDLQFHGMSLRDYFATHCPLPVDDCRTWDMEAEVRYAYADAMLKARQS